MEPLNKKEKIERLIDLKNIVIVNKKPEDLINYIKTSFDYKIDYKSGEVLKNKDLETILSDDGLIGVWKKATTYKVNLEDHEGEKDEDWSLSAASMIAIGDTILSPKFMQARKMGDTRSASIHLYKIEDDNKKVCAFVGKDSGEINRFLGGIVAQSCNSAGAKALKMHEVGGIVAQWLTNTKFTDAENGYTVNVADYGNPYIMKDDWVTFRSGWTPDENCPFPELQSTFSRIKYGPQVAALIWGTYTGQYKGRQCLWLYGEDGKEGKSTLVTFLGDKLFGENCGYKALQDAQITDSKRFANSFVEGAKLIVFPDASDQYLLDNDLVKALAGRRDSLSSEAKGVDAKTVKIDATVFVLSNFLPVVKDADYSTSRVLVCPMVPKTTEDGSKEVVLNPNIALEYEKELPGFLYWAKTQFESLYKGDEIQMPTEYNDYIRTIIDRTDSERKRVITENFVFDDEGITKSEVFRTEVKNASEYRSSEITSFINWFKKTYPNISLRKHGNISYFKGIRVKTSQEKEKESIEFTEMVRKGKLDTLNNDLDNFGTKPRKKIL